MHATIVKWVSSNGWGFAKPDAVGPDLFIHVRSFPDDVRQEDIHEGLRIRCNLATGGDTRRPRAINIAIVAET